MRNLQRGKSIKPYGLVSIAIINIKGEKLPNTLTTPRQKMKSTGEKYYGITEPMMRKQRDEYEVIEEVQRLCFGKILVGHDL
jgi:DNA polymerase III alpha subunit (gram-positive type)